MNRKNKTMAIKKLILHRSLINKIKMAKMERVRALLLSKQKRSLDGSNQSQRTRRTIRKTS